MNGLANNRIWKFHMLVEVQGTSNLKPLSPLNVVCAQITWSKRRLFHPRNRVNRKLDLCSFFHIAMYDARLQISPIHARDRVISIKNASRSCTLFHSFPKKRFNGTHELLMDEESSTVAQPHLITGSSSEQNISDDRIEEYLLHDLHEVIEDKDAAEISEKEIQRRQKIGLANKGRIPWNKGSKHSRETRERIKKRTIEALKNPKIRKKMSEHPHSHSDLSKARIGATMKRIWEARRKLKRSQEECYVTWARSIAEAARVGGHDQKQLDWESYHKLKAKIVMQHLKLISSKARAKEIAKVKAERAVKARAEKCALIARQGKAKEEKAKARKLKELERKKSEDEKRMALSKCFKLRLTKVLSAKSFRRKKLLKSSDGIRKEMAIEAQPLDEKWDMEHIKREKMQRRVSLEDRIQAVKNKKAPSDSDSSVVGNEG